MKKSNVFLILLAIIVLGGGYYWSHQADNWLFGDNHHPKELTLYGNVDIRSLNLSFRVPGRLSMLNFDEGDVVKKGQVIGKLDDISYQIALQQANANLIAAEAQLDLLLAGSRQEEIDQAKAQVEQYEAAYRYAESTFTRQQRLAASKTISADQLDNAKTARDQAKANLQTAKDKLNLLLNGARPQEIEQAKAQVAQAKSSVAKAQLDLNDTQLIAPSEGVIMIRAVEPGTMLSAGSPVLTLSLTNPIFVRAYIDGVNLSEAVPGKEVFIYTDSQAEKPYIGKIGFVSPTAEFTPKNVETEVLRTSLVYRLRIIVGQADDGLRQGMPVTIKFKE